MTPGLSKLRDGKKFMWDGRVYETREDAVQVGETYRKDNFEIQIEEEGGNFLVYTRRVVKEVAVTVQ